MFKIRDEPWESDDVENEINSVKYNLSSYFLLYKNIS